MERKIRFKIILKDYSSQPFSSIDEELSFILQSIGFFEHIDKNKTAFSLFKEIMLASEENKAFTSTELSQMVGMSRGSVLNHLDNMLESKLIVKDGRYYLPRSKSLSQIINEMESDTEQLFKRLKLMAKKIDR